MYAVVNSSGLVAKDFRTRPEAIHWVKQFNAPLRIISQDSKEFIRIENQKIWDAKSPLY